MTSPSCRSVRCLGSADELGEASASVAEVSRSWKKVES